MICYHGTTKTGLNAILNGASSKPNTPWVVSDNDGAMYMWPSDKINESNDHDNVDLEGINSGFESAQVQCLVSGEVDLFVLKMTIPDPLLEDDYSCKNMATSASFIDMDKFHKQMIVSVYHYRINVWHKPFLVSSLLQNPHFNKWAIEPELLDVAEMLDGEFLPDIYEFDYSELDLEGVLNGIF